MRKIEPIRSERDYERALARAGTLMGSDPGSPEGRELDILADLVEQYELEHYPMEELDPVDMLQLWMEEEELTPEDLAAYIGSPAMVAEILSKKRSLTEPMARALSKDMQIPAALLLREPNHQ